MFVGHEPTLSDVIGRLVGSAGIEYEERRPGRGRRRRRELHARLPYRAASSEGADDARESE